MKHRIRPFVPIILGLALAGLGLAAGHISHRKAAPDPAVVAANPGVRQAAQAETGFGFRLLARLAPAQPRQNIFFSPFSISQALALTLNGAGGATRGGIAQTLGIGTLPTGAFNAANGLLRPSLENPDPQVELTVANALWIQQGRTFAPKFQAQCQQFYDADTTALNLGSPSAAPTINHWVSQNTRGKITTIVSPLDLINAQAVLTDAVYFHGKWAVPFEKASTQPKPFTRADGSRKSVPMMSGENEWSYGQTPSFQAVRLPYGKGRIALYVFLPRKPSGLDAFLQTATAANWNGWLARMQPTEVHLLLPRFHADDALTLNDPLSRLGMASAFGPQADFAPMGLPDCYISKVLHKATLDVDEEGTVATAATAVIMTESARRPPPSPIQMRVDHPFFCAIRDDATGTLLFLGGIREPG